MKETYPGDTVSGKFTETVAEKWKVFNLNAVGTEDLGLGRGKFDRDAWQLLINVTFSLNPIKEN